MHDLQKIKSIAVIGSGVAGLTAAYLLSDRYEVTLFEKNDYIGGHTNTIEVTHGDDQRLPVDTGFIVYNDRNYPTFIRLLARLGIEGIPSDMSFGYSDSSVEYSSYVPKGLFAQKRNIFRPSFLGMVRDILKFNKQAIQDLSEGKLEHLTLGSYLEQLKMGKAFQDHYLIPMTAAIWSTSPEDTRDFPAALFAEFFKNHGLLSLGDRPKWKTIPGGSHTYVKKILSKLKGKYQTEKPIQAIRRSPDEVSVTTADGEERKYDAVIVATHADEALGLLEDPTADEKRLLGAWQYSKNHAILHTDESFMPKRKGAWASWNYTRDDQDQVSSQVTLTYHMNRLQSLATKTQYFVTLNTRRKIEPQQIIKEIDYTHPLYTFDSLRTQAELATLNGVTRTYFCGSYFHYGFHEDAVKSAVSAVSPFGVSL